MLIFLTGIVFVGIKISLINFYGTPHISYNNFKSYHIEDLHFNRYLFFGFITGSLLCNFLFKRQKNNHVNIQTL